jgi:hypothetical protein
MEIQIQLVQSGESFLTGNIHLKVIKSSKDVERKCRLVNKEFC